MEHPIDLLTAFPDTESEAMVRRHSALNYRSPVEFERLHTAAQHAA